MSSSKTRPAAKRLLLFLIWLMMVVAYFDRVNISLAGTAIMADLGLTKTQFGGALSAFQLGYALLQVPGGYLADQIGAKPLLVAALVVWSGFTALTGAARSLGALAAIRILFGIGEGLENGAQFKLIGDHFDSQERSSANGLFLSALAVGPALTAPIATWLIGHIGWRGLFLWSALPGLVVAALLYALLPGGGGRGKKAPARADSAAPGWHGTLARPASWLAFAAYLLFNIGFWGFVYWMPTYLTTARQITLAALGPAAAIPFLGGFVGLLALGWLGSQAGMHPRRPLIVAATYLLAAASLYGAFTVQGLLPCIAALTLAAFFLYGGFGPFWATALDLAPHAARRGTFTGFINLGGQIGGFLAPLVVGRIVDVTHSFLGGFLFLMAALALAAASLALLQITRAAAAAAAASPVPDDAAAA